MHPRSPVTKLISLLTIFSFLGFMAATATFASSGRGNTTTPEPATWEEPLAEEDNIELEEESDVPYIEEDGLQDDPNQPEEELNLDNLSDAELKVYLEKLNNSSR